MDVTL